MRHISGWPNLARSLTQGPVYGLFSELVCPEAVEMAGLAGWDFVVLDGEHSPLQASVMPALVRAAAAGGVAPLVRVATNEASAIQHALDCGAAGVQVPQVASLAAAEAAVAAARFHPLGRRGFNPFVRAASFSAEPIPDFLRRSNEEIVLILQIESREGLGAVDAIVELRGVNVLFIGPYDLSQSLGIPGQVNHPLVFAAGQEIVAKAEAKGVAVGVYAHTREDALRWRDAGIRYLVHGVDSVTLLDAMKTSRRGLDT